MVLSTATRMPWSRSCASRLIAARSHTLRTSGTRWPCFLVMYRLQTYVPSATEVRGSNVKPDNDSRFLGGAGAGRGRGLLTHLIMGLVGVSSRIILVAGVMAWATASRSHVSTWTVWIFMFSTNLSSRLVPPYKSVPSSKHSSHETDIGQLSRSVEAHMFTGCFANL
jgi:hypothetical protein